MYKFYPKNLVQPPGCARHVKAIMKVSSLIFAVILIQAQNNLFAQKITLDEKNAPLNKVFDKISTQSGFDFLISTDNLKASRPVSITSQNEELKNLLDRIFVQQPLQYEIQQQIVIVSARSAPQRMIVPSTVKPVKVIGKVVDTLGRPLAGATLSNKANKVVAVTDANGVFSFEASSGEQIMVSYIGFNSSSFDVTETGVNSKIILYASASGLAEISIVSTGYQNISKERITGSFEQISNDMLNRRPGTDIISRLDGNSSILFDKRVSGSPTLQIRGLSTLTQGISQPLIVLDNFPYQGDLNNINPNDIASITILKDAAAASIWGARAGNGVIVINTKKGTFNQSLKVSVNSNMSINGRPDLYDVPLLSAPDYINLEAQLFNKGAFDDKINNTFSYPALTQVQEILLKRREGKISAVDSAAQINALKNQDVRRDFLKYIYRPQVRQQHQIDVSGGSENVNYRLSAGYDRNVYNLVGNDYTRYTFNSYTTIRPGKNLQLSAGMQYVQTLSVNNSQGDFGGDAYAMRNSISSGDGSNLPIYSRLADANGRPLTLPKYRQSYLDTVGHGKLLDWDYSPLNELSANDNKSAARMVIADVGIKFSPLNFLNFDIRYRYQNSTSLTSVNHTIDSYYARDLINQFTNLSSTMANQRNPVPLGGILNRAGSEITSNNLRGQANFDRKLSSNGRLTAISGFELSEVINRTSDDISYGYNERLNITPVDNVNLYPRLLGGSAHVPYPVGFGRLNNRYLSVYGNAVYSYKSKYALSASARNDATNLFGVATRNKWKPLYSLGASWQVSNESFYHSSILTSLKLRATYGYQGNTNNSGSGYTILDYTPATSNAPVNVPAASVAQPGNPQLTWESTRQINFATDFELFSGKVSGSFEYYLKKSTDVLANATADPTTGYFTVIRNSANISGQGFDIVLNSRNVTSSRFTWLTNLILSHTSYKVTQYLAPPPIGGYVSDGSIILPIAGYSPYAIVSYKFVGLDPANGDPIGRINGADSKDWDNIVFNTPISDQDIKGSALPTFYGNLYNSFQAWRFQLGVNVIYRLGYFFRRETINYNTLYLTGYANRDYLDRWQKPGDEKTTIIPSMQYPLSTSSRETFYQYSEATVEKADNIKLQTIQLRYDLTQPALNRLGLKDLKLFANADNMNVIVWRANNKNIDPDFPIGFKPKPTISFGLRATF